MHRYKRWRQLIVGLMLITSCSLLTWSSLTGSTSSALDSTATPGTSCAAVDPAPQLPLGDEETIHQTAQREINWLHQTERSVNLEITSIHGEHNWAVIHCRPVPTDDTPDFSSEGTILIAHRVENDWQIAYPGTVEFNKWLDELPERYYSSEVKDFFRAPLGPLQDSNGIYRLPYSGGESAWVSCIGCAVGHAPAIDFVIYGQDIVAGAAGQVETIIENNTECCCDDNCYHCNNKIVILHSNGERSYYLHIAPNSVPDNLHVGDSVVQGQTIATQGDIGYSCGRNGRQEVGCSAGNVSPVSGRKCGTHLHFELRSSSGVKVQPRFQDVQDNYGTWYVSQGGTYVSGNYYNSPPPPTDTPNPTYTAAPTATPTDITPPSTSITAGPTGWIDDNDVTFQWNGSDDRTTTGNLVYSYRLDGYADWSNWANSTSKTFNNLPEGNYTFRVKARDQAGNVDVTPATRSFSVDIYAPSVPQVTIGGSGCGSVQNNVWQNSCYDPSFTWSASDTGIGVKDYHYYWGTTPSSSPDTFTTNSSFDAPAITALGGVASYYLNISARDELNHESGQATFGLRYDGSPPTATVRINAGNDTTNQVTVILALLTGDEGSGVQHVRISNNGLVWSDWQTYASTIVWTLPALDRQTLTVYVQVRDGAGNVSTTASDSVFLDLYPVMPSSVSFRLCNDVINVAGQNNLSSTHYSLVSAVGQPWSQENGLSSSYNHASGFLGSVTGCLPITHSTTTNYTITQWVVASAGQLKDSTNYLLGDTTGQSVGSGAAPFTSASYQLASGFWATISQTIPAPPVLPTPYPTSTPGPSPTPQPTPTPLPSGFGFSINEGASFTNKTVVTLTVWAPNMTEMRISNDGGFANAVWENYRITRTWSITTYGSYVMPRLVYAQFRDETQTVYGTFMDDIIYDPVAPTGGIGLYGSGVGVIVGLDASDDNSGVTDMRVSNESTFQTNSWQPFTTTLVLTDTVPDRVYAQFRDRAGNLSPIYGSDGSVIDPSAHQVYLPLVLRNP